MTRQCCVCKRVFRNGVWVHVSPGSYDPEEVTHGYCDLCSKDFERAVAEYLASLQPQPSFTTSV